MHVVTTAGHVDHGKSTLVRALTGTDPDRLAEERRRGLSIELGYAWTELPGLGEVAFVDVPGHERFLATTLAGVGPVQVAMLVVAADDPWMPQASEHLAVLDALGITHGLVVISRCDLADPADATLTARQRIAATSLRDVPVIPVSAHTGEGMDVLRDRLVTLLAAIPRPDPAADVCLWVDRRFHVRGAGTVVTGTLPAGTIRVGETLSDPEGNHVRVRAIEALGRRRDQVIGPARVALDLGGRAPTGVDRGVPLVTPGAFVITASVDVAVPDAPGLPQRPNLHVGSALVSARTRPLGTAHCRLHLDRPIPLRIGDRAVLRDPGDRALWAARVVDPLPPPLTRRGAAAARAAALEGLTGSVAEQLAMRGPCRVSLLRRIGLSFQDPIASPSTLRMGEWLVPAPDKLRARLEGLIGPGEELTPAQAARSLGLPDPAIVEALVAAPLECRDGRIRRAEEVLPEALAAGVSWLHDRLDENPFAAPTTEELRAAGLTARTVAQLHRRGDVVRLAPNVVVLPAALDRAVTVLAGLEQPFTTSSARQALGTSRRVVLPLLARLDADRRTVRLPDDTRRVTRAPMTQAD